MNSNRFYLLIILFCSTSLFFTSACKKKRAFKEENAQAAEDVRKTQEQNDEVMSAVNIAIMEQPLLRGGSTSLVVRETELCGVNIDSAGIYSGILLLNYNGTLCNGFKKTGSIKVTFLDYPIKKWKNESCRIKIDFLAYKITRQDGRSIQLDGAAYLTNESGNTWYEMRYLNAANLVQTHTANNLKVTIDESNTAVFNFNRRLTFNYSSSDKVTSCRIEGSGSSNGLSSLENWGQNRDGSVFTAQVNTPVVWKSSCGSTSPVEGEITIDVEGKYYEMNCKYGVDSNGDANVDTCPYGWKVSWSYKKKQIQG